MVTGATVDSDVRNFAYTADDERIAVKRGSSWTWTLRDQGGKVLRELTSLETSNPFGRTAQAWSKDCTFRDGLLLASISIPSGSPSPTTSHYHLDHLDHLGTPRMITSDGGTVVSQVDPMSSHWNLLVSLNCKFEATVLLKVAVEAKNRDEAEKKKEDPPVKKAPSDHTDGHS
jgi:hypothetical protein